MAMTGAEYLARTLDSYGVSSVFLVPTILSKSLYELERHTDIKRIVTHGEKAAAYMADGYARASGTPGVCMAQTVGAANLAAGLKDASLGCSPVVALTGGPYEWSRARNFYQETEDFPLFKPFTKFSAQVGHVSRLPDLLEHAFWTSVTGKPGPTHLELAGHTGDVIENAELDADIKAPVHEFHVAALRPQADPRAIAAALAELTSAQRPVIVAGGGVRDSGAGPELVALAERLNIPIATSLDGKDTVPGDHPLNVGVPGLYSRQSANEVLLEADVVFYVGSQTGSQLTLFWKVPAVSTRVVQLDIDAAELGRHYPNSVRVQADAKAGLAQLLEASAGTDHRRTDQWSARARRIVDAWKDRVRADEQSDAEPIRPERLCAELTRHLPDDALLVSDTGHAGMWTGGFVDLNKPEQGYIRAAGSLGWGLPAALGAQLANPERQTVLFTGDGGFWYHVAELETAARWQIPAVIVVNDNQSLNQEIGLYEDAYGGELTGRHGDLWHFSDADLAAVAESMGVTGIRVTRPSEIVSALEKAVTTPGPVVVDVVSDRQIVAPRGTDTPATV